MIKVFMMNDYDWVAAESLEEAIKWYCESLELPRDEVCDDPHGVTEDKLNELKFYEEWPDKTSQIFFSARPLRSSSPVRLSSSPNLTASRPSVPE